MDRLFARLKSSNSEESVDIGLSFQPQDDDIFITTYPVFQLHNSELVVISGQKCGTTWVSFIAHSLRSRGNIDFDEITAVVPWTIYAHYCGQDLNATQVATPRLFKSHENYDIVPKGGKYIYVVRNPHDVCMSFYHFLLDFVQMDVSEVSLQEFVDELFIGSGSKSGKIWDHFLSFYHHRDDSNVLWIFYEDLLEDLNSCIGRIAAFMGIPLDEELRAIVLNQSSFSFMKEHQVLFDDHLIFNACKVQMGLPADCQVRASKVNKGAKDAGNSMTPEIVNKLNSEWDKVMLASTGLASYADLRNELSFLRKQNVQRDYV